MAKIRFGSKAVEDLTSIWNYTYRTWSDLTNNLHGSAGFRTDTQIVAKQK